LDILTHNNIFASVLNTKLKTIFKMKKVFAILAIAALTACGGASTEAKTDTAAATVDTAKAKAVTVDTTKAATVDTTKAATAAPAKK
jgi:hypothetical protein